MALRLFTIWCVTLWAAFAGPGVTDAAAQSPFSPRSAPEQAAPAKAPLFSVPAPIKRALTQVARWQRDINRYLSEQLRDANKTGGLAAVWAVLAASFAYGVLHAGGPGHGKLVVASYFAAREAPLSTGILMGSAIAVTQAVVAILAVGIMAIVLGTRQSDVVNSTMYLEMVSYGLIFGIGAWMVLNTLKGKAACGHDHGGDHTHDDGHGHEHDHDHHGHHHGPDPNAKHTWLARTARSLFGRYGEVLAISVVSGLRPCSGSILVLLFALANGVFFLGVAAAFVMAAGVAITISALGIGAIVLRRTVAGGHETASPARQWISRGLAFGGSCAVMAMGGVLLAATMENAGWVG